MAFNWNTLFSFINAKMKDVCTVGRYVITKEPKYPYLDVKLSDASGGNYDLQNNEGSQTVLVALEVYCNNHDDATCYEVSMKAKELMLSYGFQCKTGPVKADNTDPAVARWVARYQRTFGDEDELRKLN